MHNHPNRNQGPKSPSIVQSTLDTIQMPGMSSRHAATALIESLNDDLGTGYDTARLGQWRRGERQIPQPVQDWMLRVCISHAIWLCGGTPPDTDDALDRLAAMLCPPVAR